MQTQPEGKVQSVLGWGAQGSQQEGLNRSFVSPARALWQEATKTTTLLCSFPREVGRLIHSLTCFSLSKFCKPLEIIEHTKPRPLLQNSVHCLYSGLYFASVGGVSFF